MSLYDAGVLLTGQFRRSAIVAHATRNALTLLLILSPIIATSTIVSAPSLPLLT